MKHARTLLDFAEEIEEGERVTSLNEDGLRVARSKSRYQLRAAAHAWLDDRLSFLFDQWDADK